MKDNAYDIMTLCHLCHQQVENGDLEIMGYKQTSEGIKVDYKIIEKQILLEKKQRKKKYSPEQILIILEYKNKTNANITKTRNLLELDIGLKISYQIVKKIWNNDY